jgi:F-type H+-transporting ATPase subunit delta
MSVSSIGARYARALFELGEETSNLGELTQQVRRMADVYSGNADLRSVLDNPIVEDAARDGVLTQVAGRLGLAPLVVNAMRLLAQRQRMAALPEIARVLERLADEKNAVLRASVTSAAPLADGDARRIAEQLERRFQRRIVLETRTDPSLIGGVVTRIGDHVIDGSVAGRLAALERSLLQT